MNAAPSIWLIRHGESVSNAGGRTLNPADIPLTARGEAQALEVAAAFERAPGLVVVSPYRRTRQTAAPTLERFPQARRADWPVQEFTFLNPEHFRNTTYLERKPWVAEYWARGDPWYEDGGGAESFAALIERVEITIARLRQQAEFTAVFSHGLFIYALLWRLRESATPLSSEAMRDFYAGFQSQELSNGAIVPLEIPPAGMF